MGICAQAQSPMHATQPAVCWTLTDTYYSTDLNEIVREDRGEADPVRRLLRPRL